MTTKRITSPLFLLLFLLVSAANFAQNLNMTLRSQMTFQNNTIANVCGYAADGREYALLGGSKGTYFIDVTNPDAPVQIVQIPGPDNTWKEIKTYRQFAFVTTEGGGGLQIIDMSKLPSPDLDYHSYTGDGDILAQLETIHALHIDTTKGYCYLYGTNLFDGGAVVLDLNGDPFNPIYAGKFDQLGYIHDGYVDNDTMYAGHIGAGFFSIVNMANKAAPELINIQRTPDGATHNTWISEDRKVLYTTDEVDDSFLAAYDVSDPDDIKFLDKVQVNPGSQTVVHNTHVRGNFTITSWYTSGVVVVDGTRPGNLVITGVYDTWPNNNAGGFNGCWGVYPFLPSGTIIAANIPAVGFGNGELFVLTPNYARACYLEGKITNVNTGAAIPGAALEIVNGDANAKDLSDVSGNYKTGQAQAGKFSLKITKLGYEPKTVDVDLIAGQVTVADVKLTPVQTYSIFGNVVEKSGGASIPGAKVMVFNNDVAFESKADNAGQFTLNGIFPGKYTVIAGAWGYLYGVYTNQNLQGNGSYTFELDKGYRDDFIFDYGWTSTATSLTGLWERGEPIGVNPGFSISPEVDFTADNGNQCYVTGNTSNVPGADDVESGNSLLNSPPMDLSKMNDPTIRGYYWFTNLEQNAFLPDSLYLTISNGIDSVRAAAYSGAASGWKTFQFKVKPLLQLTDKMHFHVVADESPNNPNFDSYEAAIDFFRVTDATVGTDNPDFVGKARIFPNPFRQEAVLEFELPENECVAKIYDLTGRQVEAVNLAGQQGVQTLGSSLETGVYFLKIEKENQTLRTLKLVKTGM